MKATLVLHPDPRLLFSTHPRLFAYGFLPVILALYLGRLGLSKLAIGPLFHLPE